jgi:hypothetical protein
VPPGVAIARGFDPVERLEYAFEEFVRNPRAFVRDANHVSNRDEL